MDLLSTMRLALNHLLNRISGTSEHLSLENKFLNLSLFYVSSFCLFAFIQNAVLGLDDHLNYVISGIILFLSGLYYISRVKNKFNLASWLLAIGGGIAIAISWFFNGGISGPTTYIWITALGILSFISVSLTKRFAIGIFIVIITALFIHNFYFPSYTHSYIDRKTHFLDLYFTLITASITLFLTFNFALKNYRKAKQQADKQILEISEKNLKINLQSEKQKELLKMLSRNEKKLKYQQEQIETMHKMLNHDMINNLSSINSSIKLYKTTNDKQYLDAIIPVIKKSSELIANIREQESIIKRDDIQLHLALHDILKKIKTQHPMINIHIHEDLLLVADNSLQSIFDNIITNAFIHGKTDTIDITYYKDKNDCVIKVIDYGIGIPIELQDKVFDEGFHHGKTGRTGIGLYLVKKTIERFGGSIYIENTIPRGTTFVIKIKQLELQNLTEANNLKNHVN